MADARAFIAIWPRGYVKSTFCEAGAVYLGAKGSLNTDRHLQLESDWERWLFAMLPAHMGGENPAPLADYHREFWDWLDGQHSPKRYGIYVSDTQDQAEQHVSNIGDMLTTAPFARWYPKLASRKLTKFGHSAGWRRTRLRTASGLTIDAAGLDKGIRGMRVEDARPDFIVFDDLDRENDSPTVTQRKINNLTRSILPAAGPDCIYLGAQNLILRGGIFTQLADGTADWLASRTVSGPHPALRDFDPNRHLEGLPTGGWRITGGKPTWRDMAYAQRQLEDYGREAFLVECQHMLSEQSGLVFPTFDPEVHEYRFKELPEFVAYFGGADFGGEGDGAHNSALTVAGVTRNQRLILLDEWYGNGANIEERQMDAMAEFNDQYPGIRWCIDGDERTYFQTLRKRLGPNVQMAKRTKNAAKERRRRFGYRLATDGSNRPGFYYLRKCARFRYEVERWRRKRSLAGEEFADAPIEVDDDVLVSVLYLNELYELGQDIPQGVPQKVLVAAM